MSKPLSKEELLAQFDDLEGDDLPNQQPKAAPADTKDDDDDPVAELAALAAAKPPSRATTPKLSSSSNASNRSPRRTGQVTPSSTGSARNSEDKGTAELQRKSQDATRSYHQGVAAYDEKSAAQAEEQKQSSGGGWWGSILSTASAAAKQAESALKEIQKNEEAQRWAEQVKGGAGLLRSYGDEIRSRAVPTFTQLIHTLAPPISQHERLLIHITHDLHNYPALDPIIYATFSRVMSQVEGGDLMVIQKGSESRQGPDSGFTGGSTAGWTDGPWWRDVGIKRDLGAVKGLVEGTKLVRVSAESYATDFFSSKGGVEEAAKAASEVLSESSPVRSSDIFLAIQAISHNAPADLFGGSTNETKVETGGVEEPPESDGLIAFAIYLYDPIHSITFHTLSQSFPQKWADWLDASPAPAAEDSTDPVATLPAEIKEILESGGVDPREWVAEWMEEVIQLAVGVIAQRYVARRMGVGEGGIGRGKARQRAEESGGGEAARAI